MTSLLKSPREADRLIAKLFGNSKKCSVYVREDKAFQGDDWLSLGSVALFQDTSGGIPATVSAIRKGSFEWELPSTDSVERELVKLLAIKDVPKSAPKIRRMMDAIAAIGVRAGLVHPRFDPHALEIMPFRRSTTVVADTSGAIQGGLDFVARYLHPAARIKVPAVVQMEIVNFADRFMSCRRATRIRPMDILIDHLMSQGGQRVLLRLELSADTEVERTFLLGDPLRSAFQKESDPDLSELNLSVAVRSYADRLILEAARQHQAQSNFGHKVQLLTSDQGLARMALAEGIAPLFFNSVVAKDLLGSRVTGVTLNPFTGSMNEVSLTAVLWEFATAFGSLKLVTEGGEHSIQISAFGDGLSWSPYQSHADLLWCDTSIVDPSATDTATVEGSPSPASGEPSVDQGPSNAPEQVNSSAKSAPSPSVAILRPKIEKLFQLIVALDDERKLSEDSAQQRIGAKAAGGLDEYRRFLTSGDLISLKDKEWVATDALTKVAIAIRSGSPTDLLASLQVVPSVRRLTDELKSLSIGHVWDIGDFARGQSTYVTLGECTHICASVFGKGVFPTPSKPKVSDFAVIASRRFKELDRGDGLVATGAWLEALIEKDGIHPEVARDLLEDASVKNLVRRTTEGSTLETSFDKHIVHVLRYRDGKPRVDAIHLYRGDYLIPDKSSVSLRIEVQGK